MKRAVHDQWKKCYSKIFMVELVHNPLNDQIWSKDLLVHHLLLKNRKIAVSVWYKIYLTAVEGVKIDH